MIYIGENKYKAYIGDDNVKAPQHDYFYVEHSSTGIIEKIPLTYDIYWPGLVTTGTKYGGLYSDWAGKGDYASIIENGQADTLTFVDGKLQDINYIAYNGDVFNTSNRFLRANAYTSIQHPVKDTIYYLCEPKDEYFNTYIELSYTSTNIDSIYVMTSIDSSVYNTIVFFVRNIITQDENEYSGRSGSSVGILRDGVSVKISATDLNSSILRGYVSFVSVIPEQNSCFEIKGQYVTLDGYSLYNTIKYVYTNNMTTDTFVSIDKPYDAELEYLQSDGNQSFTLPVIPSEATDAIEISFRCTSSTVQQRFCLANSESTFQVYINASGRVAYSRNDTWTAAWNNDTGKIGLVKHNLKIDYYNNIVTYDCTIVKIDTTSKTATHNLVITGKYGSSYTGLIGHIYGIKFWRSDELMFDLIPVRKNGVGYFFDKINAVFYENEGTGSWTLGYDKLTNISDYKKLKYIENTRTTATAPYIDTGIASNAGIINMNMHVMWNTIDSSKRQLMGVSTGPFWGCDEGEYKSNNTSMSLQTPSTDTFDNIHMIPYSTPSTVNSIGLFRALNPTSKGQTTTTYICLCKLAAYKISVNNKLVRDYVPVLHPAGVYGLFDNIENKFYASATSVDFTGE